MVFKRMPPQKQKRRMPDIALRFGFFYRIRTHFPNKGSKKMIFEDLYRRNHIFPLIPMLHAPLLSFVKAILQIFFTLLPGKG